MAEDRDIAELRRRVTLLEEDAKGEKADSRHILRKVSENESLLVELKKEVFEVKKEMMDLKKDMVALRDEVTLLRADIPGIIANVVGALLREERMR